PVYNAGSYLHRCLDSLIQQTLTNIEIILVLDCPTDGSDRIAESFAQKDVRIKLIRNTTNLHIGLSRNEGLKVATGKYVIFSDHDDWRDPDMLERLYLKGEETHTEVICGSYMIIENGKQYKRPPFPSVHQGNELKKDILSHLIGNFYKEPEWIPFTRIGALWHYMFNREFLIRHCIVFSDNRQLSPEDLYFLINVLSHCQSFAEIPDTYYYHNNYATSSLNDYEYFSTPRILSFLEKVYVLLYQQGTMPCYILHYNHSVLFFLHKSILNELKYQSVISTIQQIKLIKKNETIKTVIKDFPLSWRVLKSLRIKKSLLLLLLKL
ncbi:MAG: glycosyltransferase, partial [Odoribacter sp.]